MLRARRQTPKAQACQLFANSSLMMVTPKRSPTDTDTANEIALLQFAL